MAGQKKSTLNEQLQSAWRKFDKASSEAQSILLGEVTMKYDSALRTRLFRRLGVETELSNGELAFLGKCLLDFNNVAKSDREATISATIDTMSAALDRREYALISNTTRDGASDTFLSMQQLGLLPREVWHEFMLSLLNSEMSGGWFWRSILQDAFRRLTLGDHPMLFSTSKKGTHGRPLELVYLRRLAVLHVYFLVGQGEDTRVAQGSVTSQMNIGQKTLESWGTKLSETPIGANDIECAKIAGMIGDGFRRRTANDFDTILEHGVYDGRYRLNFAEDIYWQLNEYSAVRLAAMHQHAKRKPKS